MKQSISSQAPRVKLLILGEGGVGKTSLLAQFVQQQFKPTLMPTIGVEYKQKMVEGISMAPVRVQVWDTAGTERFKTITPIFYKNCDGVLLVFDICDKRSFETVNFWIEELNNNSNVDNIEIMLVGNKCDLDSKREVSKTEAAELAKAIDSEYFQTSAKSFEKTNEAFNKLITKVLESKGTPISSDNRGSFKLIDNKSKKYTTKCTKNCCSN